MIEVKEKDSYDIEISFKDSKGIPVTPTSVVYRVDDVSSETKVIEDATIYPSSSTFTITIPSTSNALLDQANDREERVVTISVYYGTISRKNLEHRYVIKNLAEIS